MISIIFDSMIFEVILNESNIKDFTIFGIYGVNQTLIMLKKTVWPKSRCSLVQM